MVYYWVAYSSLLKQTNQTHIVTWLHNPFSGGIQIRPQLSPVLLVFPHLQKQPIVSSSHKRILELPILCSTISIRRPFHGFWAHVCWDSQVCESRQRSVLDESFGRTFAPRSKVFQGLQDPVRLDLCLFQTHLDLICPGRIWWNSSELAVSGKNNTNLYIEL